MAATSERPPGRYRALLRRPGFLAYFVTIALGDAGYALYAISVLWLAIEVSHGSAAVAGVVLAVEFGIYALSFLAGPVIDRVRDLARVLRIGFPLQAGLAFGLGAVALAGRLDVPTLLLFIVALSVVWDFTWTAENAALPRIVPADDLFLANGLSGAVSGGNQIAGYAAGASLLLLLGSPGVAMLLYGALNAAAALGSLAFRAPRAELPSPSFLRDVREGFRYLTTTRSPPVLSLIAYSTAQGFLSAAGPLFLTVVAYRAFPVPTTDYGLLFSVFAVGGVGGSLLLGQASPRRRVGQVLALGALLEGPLLALSVAVAPALWASLTAWLLLGFVDVVFYASVVTFLQATTPPALVGRTMSNAYLFRGTSRAVGALVLGAVATTVAPLPLAIAVAIGFVAVGLAGAAVPRIRALGF